MLNEPSILASGKSETPARTSQATSPRNTVLEQLETAVSGVMDIYQVNDNPPPPVGASFTGRLRVESDVAYETVDRQFADLDYHAILTTDEEDRHVIIALKGRIRPKPRPLWPHLVLLILTLLSMLFVGASQHTGEVSYELWLGLPYAISMILILGTHELGHYFAARRHGVSVTLPYFIPFPFGLFGTLGAFIQLREPMRNRKILFDVGAAGPLAGLVVALPVLLIGLATSDIKPLPTQAYLLEGDSLLYAGSKFLVFGQFLPNATEDVFINQLAMAGWTGLFITGLNLIPLGQLDGGHVIFTLFGRRAQRLYLPILAGFFALSFYNPSWLFWTLLLFVLGRVYAVPLDTVTPLDQRRRWLGYLAMAIFVLVFVPNPFHSVQP
jgi:Zn-dependent protease